MLLSRKNIPVDLILKGIMGIQCKDLEKHRKG